ncbi:MAG: helix-turn-helix transcriptional regulator [Ardenticatenales bacterium]|nr:helix-turn-helix transcriptional regulator [Ardenticatenales bacterium]
MSSLNPLDVESATTLAEFFTAMSDPTRVRIISALACPGAEFSVQTLAEGLGMTHSAVSHQLRLLRRLRVVRARREGRQRFYALDDEHVAQLYHQGLDHVRHS